MNPGLIHDNLFDYVYSLVIDILIFTIKSIYFFAETVFLTLLPDRLRKMKVSCARTPNNSSQYSVAWKRRKESDENFLRLAVSSFSKTIRLSSSSKRRHSKHSKAFCARAINYVSNDVMKLVKYI